MVEQTSIIKDQYNEAEDNFEMIIPEFGVCGAENDPGVVEESKVRQQLIKSSQKAEVEN